MEAGEGLAVGAPEEGVLLLSSSASVATDLLASLPVEDNSDE